MARMYKIEGSGPLAGFVAFGEIAHLDLFTKQGVVFDLDQEFRVGDRSGTRVTISSTTGAALTELGETDILRLAPVDLPRLQDAVFRWSGHVG